MRAPAVAVLALLAVTACTRGADAPAPAPTSDRATACGLLDGRQRQELTGQRIDTVADPAQAAIGLQCRWEQSTTFIEVSSLDAAAWASSLPSLIDGLRKSGRTISADDQTRLDRIVTLVQDRKSLSAADACDLFPTIAGVVAADPGQDFVVFVPAGDRLGVQAQTCTDGVFSSVVFAAPGLTRSPAVEARARTALETVHRNAIASGALAT